jgi:hypothetical protein
MNMWTRPDTALASVNRGGPLNEDQIRRLAPSIFASGKHESRSDRYTYIPTWEVVQSLIREGFEPTFAKQGRSRVPGKEDFTKHMIRLRHGTQQMRQVGDVRPEIVLINSHDGTSSYNLMAGLFRLVCLNGMVVADGIVDTVKVGHTGNIQDKVIEGTWSLVEQVDRVMERPEQWRQLQLTGPEQHAFAEAAHELRFDGLSEATQKAIEPAQLNRARRAEDRGDTLWQTFNRVQESVIRGGMSGWARRTNEAGNPLPPRRVTMGAVGSIDGDVKLNRALWVLAEEMAKIKGAA